MLARRGDIAVAEAMLAPVSPRDECQFSEWRSILLAQRALALGKRQLDAVALIAKLQRDLDDLTRE